MQLWAALTSLQAQFQGLSRQYVEGQRDVNHLRKALSIFAEGPSAAGAREQAISDQVSPVGGEGSNIMPMPWAPPRPDPSEVRGAAPRGCGDQGVREATPQAGSTAGEENRLNVTLAQCCKVMPPPRRQVRGGSVRVLVGPPGELHTL